MLVACSRGNKTVAPVTEVSMIVPDYPKKVQRYSDFEITIRTNFKDKRAEVVDSTMKFSLDGSEHWHIKHDNMVVIDSIGDKNHLEIYLLRQKGFKLFAGYATINNIAISTVGLNYAQTAYHVRGSFYETQEEAWIELKTSYVHNKDQLHIPANSGVRVKKWSAFSLEDVDRISPAVTIIPCYLNGKTARCHKKNADDISFSNIDFSIPITLQPLATVGYRDFDWLNYNFKNHKLVEVSQEYPKPRSDKIIALAEAETEQVLKKIPKKIMDIGWYGFPKEKRDKIMRYHLTRLYFKLVNDKNLQANKIVIPKDGIKARHFNTDEDEPEFKSIKNQEMHLQEKRQYNVETPPPKQDSSSNP